MSTAAGFGKTILLLRPQDIRGLTYSERLNERLKKKKDSLDLIPLPLLFILSLSLLSSFTSGPLLVFVASLLIPIYLIH